MFPDAVNLGAVNLGAASLVPLFGGAMSGIFTIVFYILFFLASIMSTTTARTATPMLLQEGKGGGFTAAF